MLEITLPGSFFIAVASFSGLAGESGVEGSFPTFFMQDIILLTVFQRLKSELTEYLSTP